MAWSESQAWRKGTANQKFYQALLEDLYGEPAERGQARVSHRVSHFALEFVSVPYTTLRVAEGARSQNDM